jgi:phosphoglycolate phosphatase-like HAD superfamily hydrolase
MDKTHQLYNIDLNCSFIDHHPSDIQCGLNAGITPIYLLTGHVYLLTGHGKNIRIK